MRHVHRWALLLLDPRVWRCNDWPTCRAMCFDESFLNDGPVVL